jgi:hypothetical protein
MFPSFAGTALNHPDFPLLFVLLFVFEVFFFHLQILLRDNFWIFCTLVMIFRWVARGSIHRL